MEKLSFGAPIGAVMQIAFVVEDMGRELEHWTRVLHIGPFFHVPHFPLINAQYRGALVSPDLEVAFAFSGGTCFEFVRQNDDIPSPFRTPGAPRETRFHHWGVPTRTFEADLRAHEANGRSVVATATVGFGARCAFIESNSGLGGLIELIEVAPPVEELFDMMHAAAQSWDGSAPVRRLGP